MEAPGAVAPFVPPRLEVFGDKQHFTSWATVYGNRCRGKGQNCTLIGHDGVLRDGDWATIVGNGWVVYCKDASTITDRGSNNTIISKPGRRPSSRHSVAPKRPRPAVRLPAAPHACFEATEGEVACVVCMHNRVDSVLQPCGHACLCMSCAGKTAHCPMCRSPTTSVVAIRITGIKT